MKWKVLVALLLVPALLFAQKNTSPYVAVDRMMTEPTVSHAQTTTEVADYINANFTSEPGKVRAVFIWVASNISYDVPNMFAMNFNETKEEKIKRTMKSRVGVCENYAAIFNEICGKVGLTADIVVGYTRQPAYTNFVRHGWNAVRVNGAWQLFDPTWGSGVIMDDQFVRKINDEYFNTAPSALIHTHMPYDPMWQLSYHPITSKDFDDSRFVANSSRPYFSFPDTIASYLALPDHAKLVAEARRLSANGVTNQTVHDRLTNLYANIEVNDHNAKVAQQNKVVETYNEAVDDMNKGVNGLNDFINYRNRQFKPAKTDAEIQAMLDKVDKHITGAQAKLKSIRGGYDKIDEMMVQVEKNIIDITKTLDDQKQWLAQYLSKSKLGRKSMFYKYSWMGVPLN
ncbi:MAG: hypothetical protein KF744_15460 [Taibaiella sp.]|nr:hypothetical protein [Taibaiella sp.]